LHLRVRRIFLLVEVKSTQAVTKLFVTACISLHVCARAIT
jgi:hypothetical protein